MPTPPVLCRKGWASAVLVDCSWPVLRTQSHADFVHGQPYNRPGVKPCRCVPALASAITTSPRSLARAGWGRCGKRLTRNSTAMLR